MSEASLTKHDKTIWKASEILARKVPKGLFHYTFPTIKDCFQQGWVCLLQDKKISKLDPTIDGGMIYSSVYRDLQDHIRATVGREKKSAHKTMGIMSQVAALDDPGYETDPTTLILANEIATYLNERISLRDQQIFKWIYLEGKPAKEVADLYGFSESRVSQILKKINEKASKRFPYE